MEGFRQLLPCAHDVIALHVPEVASDETGRRSERIALNSTVEERLGLSLSAQPDNRGVEFGGDKTGGRGAAAGSEGTGPFDVSVLCTAYLDLWALFSPGQNELDARLAGPLMWNVNVSSPTLLREAFRRRRCICALTDRRKIIGVGDERAYNLLVVGNPAPGLSCHTPIESCRSNVRPLPPPLSLRSQRH